MSLLRPREARPRRSVTRTVRRTLWLSTSQARCGKVLVKRWPQFAARALAAARCPLFAPAASGCEEEFVKARHTPRFSGTTAKVENDARHDRPCQRVDFATSGCRRPPGRRWRLRFNGRGSALLRRSVYGLDECEPISEEPYTWAMWSGPQVSSYPIRSQMGRYQPETERGNHCSSPPNQGAFTPAETMTPSSFVSLPERGDTNQRCCCSCFKRLQCPPTFAASHHTRGAPISALRRQFSRQRAGPVFLADPRARRLKYERGGTPRERGICSHKARFSDRSCNASPPRVATRKVLHRRSPTNGGQISACRRFCSKRA